MSEQSKQVRKLALKSPSKAVAELLLEFADYMDSANIKRKELDGIIEQQQQRITELELQVRSVSLSRDEQAATVERLREFLANRPNMGMYAWIDKFRGILLQTPQQNLNAVKREVYADGYYQGFSDAWHSNFDWEQDHVNFGLEQSEIKAEQEYPSGKG